MKKKMFALTAALLAVILTACGAGGKRAGEAMAPQADHTLTVWCWDTTFNIYAMKEAEKIYQKEHPGFKLTIVETTSHDVETKVTTAALSGDLSTLPDIFLMQDNSFQKFLNNFPEVFTDLTGTISFRDFSPAMVDYSKKDGKNYGLPFDNGAAIFAVRTDLIGKAGLTAKDFTDITWSRFIELGRKVKEATGLPLIEQQAGSPALVAIMLHSCGASSLNEDGSVYIKGNPQLKQAMQYYVEMVESGVMGEVTASDQYIGALNNGTVAGTVNGCWILAAIQMKEDQSGKWAVTNIPSMDGVMGATNYSSDGGSGWAVSSNCKNKELATDFLSNTFGGSVELFDTILPKSGALTTYLPAANSEIYKQPQAFFAGQSIYEDITNFAGLVPTNITGAYYYNSLEAIGVALTNIIQSGADIDREIESAQSSVDFDIAGE